MVRSLPSESPLKSLVPGAPGRKQGWELGLLKLELLRVLEKTHWVAPSPRRLIRQSWVGPSVGLSGKRLAMLILPLRGPHTS